MKHLFKTQLLNLDLILQKAKIKEGLTIADFGCGKFGHFSFTASELVGDRGKVYAVDVIKTNLQLIDKEIINNNIKNVQTVWSDLEVPKATKIQANSIDIIFLINILHEAKKPFNITAEAQRLLKPGGRLIIVEWKKTACPLGPKKEIKIDQQVLIIETQKQGWHLEEVFAAGQYHFGLIFIKL